MVHDYENVFQWKEKEKKKRKDRFVDLPPCSAPTTFFFPLSFSLSRSVKFSDSVKSHIHKQNCKEKEKEREGEREETNRQNQLTPDSVSESKEREREKNGEKLRSILLFKTHGSFWWLLLLSPSLTTLSKRLATH